MSEHTKLEFERPERDMFNPNTGHYTVPENFLLGWIDSGNEELGQNYIEVHGPDQEMNAKRIAKAVNLHDELVDALERSETAILDAMNAGNLSREYSNSVISKIESTLKKAKEQA